MQKVVNVYYNDVGSYVNPHRDLNALLEKGWKVVQMQSFSQAVSATTYSSGHASKKVPGEYGMTFVLEKEDKPK